ncbi:MAG: rhodanese-like domain-containing protein, partial [Flavobacteriales bacterium]
NANPEFEAHIAKDGEVFEVGAIKIKVLHTPGHTMESTCYLLSDETGKEVALFSGDTLFIGDVGRPDLAQKAAHMTQEQLAETLFDSLRTKIMPLSDEIIVYPAHGAGSACGKNMSKETTDTLGNQKATNYALRADMTKEEFVKEVTNGLMPPPAYFPLNVALNKKGYESIDTVLDRGLHGLSPDAFETAANETGAIMLDVRNAQEFAKAFVPNSINIGLDGQFAPWVGALIPDIKQEILIITTPGNEEEVVTRLSRVGYDHVIGFLEGGVDAWKSAGKEIDMIQSISAEELAAKGDVEIIDARKASENFAERIATSENMPLDNVNDHMASIDKNKTYYVHCAGGYRSMIFVSILRARGFDNLVDVKGGFKAIKESNLFKLTDYVCPSTML